MYAIFSIRKLTATARLNMAQIQLMNLDDQQFALATEKMNIENDLAQKRIDNYKKMQGLSDEDRQAFEDQMQIDEAKATQDKNAVAYQENAIELQKKSLETVITKWTKELEQIEKAEEQGIERANPKYTGLG